MNRVLLVVALILVLAVPAEAVTLNSAPPLFSTESFEQACQDYPATLNTYELKHYTLSEDASRQYCTQQEPMENGGNYYVWRDKATGELGTGEYH